jgi:SAM-dependent methyltransferase
LARACSTHAWAVAAFIDCERIHVSEYYSHKLSAAHLKHVYEIAPPRVRQYLEAEVNHSLEKIHPGDNVVELGCGYGRVLSRLAGKAGWVAGVDTSLLSLRLAQETLSGISNCSLSQMHAIRLGFKDQVFDAVVCIQNGISAFHVNQRALIRESIRVTRPGGAVLFSSYSEKFWRHRLQWFELQSKAGLLGEIDHEKTSDGLIVCKDGFTATTVRSEDFLKLADGLDVHLRIVEVDESSVFFEIVTPE